MHVCTCKAVTYLIKYLLPFRICIEYHTLFFDAVSIICTIINLIHVCFLIQPLENVQEEEEDDDNSFDHRDDMSESLPTGDGGSESKTSDEVDDGTSKAKKARKGRKKTGVTLSPKCKVPK
jgi:hypothetical protein